ncbi:MAG TPA: sulfatase [Rhodopirellula sp.]|nr:sulfatase [Rhodopirellula sp.]
MTRHDTLLNTQLFSSLLLILLIAGTWAASESSGTERSAQSPPNILVIISEDNGQELGCYGNPHVKTPVLNGLASEGVRFHNAYVPQAGCSQSRAAYLTGLYPHQNGQIGLATWNFRMYNETQPNLVQSLHDAGYRTGVIGKIHVNPKTAFPFDFKRITTSNFARQHLKKYATEASTFFTESSEPFFLAVNYPDAHRPFTKQVAGLPAKPLSGSDVPPLNYMGLDSPQLRTETANYYNCMNRLDHLIGDLLSTLKESGKDKDTLVVYFGDHGADLLRGKRTSYEGGVRVPMIIRWPGHTKPGTVRTELVTTLDLMPTLLDAAGAPAPEKLPGQSLAPLFQNEAAQWREHLYTEYHLHSAHNFFPQRTVRDSRYKLIKNLQPDQINPGYAFTINRFFEGLPEVIQAASPQVRSAYRLMERPPEYELYDLQNDPWEFENLAADPQHRQRLETLREKLKRWRVETNDPLLNPVNRARLKTEIESCFIDGKPVKKALKLDYPNYFFD